MEIYCTPISSVHQWDNDCSQNVYNQCWDALWPESVAHNALGKVVLQDTLLQDIEKLTDFHHADSLEVFHFLLLKYCLH